MALTLNEKKKLKSCYENNLEWVKWVVVMQHSWIPVNQMNSLRLEIECLSGKISVVKKRVFLKTMVEKWYEDVGLETLDGPIAILYLYGEEDYEPLKLVEKYIKYWTKKDMWCGFEFLWGWLWTEWNGREHIKELANMPSRDELIGKFAFLMNYPVQSFAFALNQISEQKWE